MIDRPEGGEPAVAPAALHSEAALMPNQLTVSDLMSDRVISVRHDDGADQMLEIMHQHRVRHLPVTDGDGRLLGLVTHRDLLRLGAESDVGAETGLTAHDVMTREVTTVGPDRELGEAAQIMFENKYGCLPVVSNGAVVGILTEADFVRHLSRPH